MIIEYLGKIGLNSKNEEIIKNNSASCLSPIASSSSSSSTTTTTTTTINNHPFMIYYNNYMNLKLTIDSSTNGNLARFIRKSCAPNCHLEHFIDNNGQIHIIVISTQNIPKGAELTLPYDDIKDYRLVLL